MTETKFITDRPPCTQCGTQKRYASTGSCVSCMKTHNERRRRNRRTRPKRSLRSKTPEHTKMMARAILDVNLDGHCPFCWLLKGNGHTTDCIGKVAEIYG